MKNGKYCIYITLLKQKSWINILQPKYIIALIFISEIENNFNALFFIMSPVIMQKIVA